MTQPRGIHVVIKADVSEFVREMAKAQRAIEHCARVLRRYFERPSAVRLGPAPLPIDGHEYRRRQRRRHRKGNR